MADSLCLFLETLSNQGIRVDFVVNLLLASENVRVQN